MKTPIISVILSLAAVTSSGFADQYTLPIHSGWNLMANQLDNGSNTLNEIMPAVPDGCVLYKYNNSASNWNGACYSTALGSWSAGNIALRPGDGAILNSPTNFTLILTGTPHVPVLPVTIPNGACYFLSRQTNDIGFYTNIVGTPPNNARVYKWTGVGYTPYLYHLGVWTPSNPAFAIGEPGWFAPSGGAPPDLSSAPMITQQPQSLTVTQGQTATFNVAATGQAPLSYQWRFNGTNIAGVGTNTCIITNAQFSDSGLYDVVVTNTVGSMSSIAAGLTVIAPPAVVTLPADSVTNNSATLNGTVNPGYAATTAWFEWGKWTNYGQTTAPVALSAGGSPVAVSTPVNGLASGTTYHFRLVATNSSGAAYGGDLLFTSATMPPEMTTFLLLTLTNPVPAAEAFFGRCVAALGGDRMLVGAHGDDTGASNAGAAFLFNLNGALLTTFTNPTPASGDFFGYALAAVGNDRVLVGALFDDTGATDAGSAYLFNTNGTLLITFTNPAPASGDFFARAVAAVGSDRVLISAHNDGTGAAQAGVAYLFSTNGALLTTYTNPTPASADFFGFTLAAVGADKVLIGAPYKDTGAVNTGAAYLFNTNGTLLATFTNPAPASDDYFGYFVAAIGAQRVLIGAPYADIGATNAGAAYLFDLSGQLLTTYTNPAPASDDFFGWSATAAGPAGVLIGAYQADIGATNTGAAYLFDLAGSLVLAFTNPAPAASDWFGCSVAALGDNLLLIGAYGDDTAGTNAGAAYLFSYGFPPVITEHQITATTAWETTPRLGHDGISTLVVFTRREMLTNGSMGNGDIWYQRLDTNGAAMGSAVQVTSAFQDNQLNDISGDYLVYTAYESTSSASGRIMVYQISTTLLYGIGSALVLQEARICGNKVAWREGAPGATMIMLYDLSWLGTMRDPDIIPGQVPPTYNVDISDRFVVWSEFIVPASNYDVFAYDLTNSVTIRLTCTTNRHERDPSTSGPWITWQTRDRGVTASRIVARNMDTGEERVIADNGVCNYRPSVDGDLIAYDGFVPGNTNDLDIFVYRLSTRETFRITDHPADQYLNDVFGQDVAYVDQRTGSEDIYVSHLQFAPVATLSANANLANLVLSAGPLAPAFDSAVTNYTAPVPNHTNSVTVTPTSADANATIQVRVNGGSFSNVLSGTASPPLPLNVGTNLIDVKVTAQDLTTIKTYTVWITIYPAAELRVVLTGTNTLLLAWPAALTGCDLEQNADLSTTNWVAVTNAPVIVGDEKQVLIAPATGQNFYRLNCP